MTVNTLRCVAGVDPELYELTTAKLDSGSSGSRVADAFARLMSTMEKTSTSTRWACPPNHFFFKDRITVFFQQHFSNTFLYFWQEAEERRESEWGGSQSDRRAARSVLYAGKGADVSHDADATRFAGHGGLRPHPLKWPRPLTQSILWIFFCCCCGLAQHFQMFFFLLTLCFFTSFEWKHLSQREAAQLTTCTLTQ